MVSDRLDIKDLLEELDPIKSGEVGLSTYSLSGIGGELKADLEDFEVTERPSYQPCGEGEHLFVWLRKKGISGQELKKHIAEKLSLPPNEIGMAGIKDAEAVTYQYISVPKRFSDRIEDISTSQVEVLHANLHTNKLHTGHLQGNSFKVVLSNVKRLDSGLIEEICAQISEKGLLNFYGPQRFLNDGKMADLGFKMLSFAAEGRSIRIKDKWRRKFAISAAQSWVYNKYLLERIGRYGVEKVLHGDVLKKRDSGGLFIEEDILEAANRFNNKEVVHTGPIFGRKCFKADGESLELEKEILQLKGIDDSVYSQFGKLILGARRNNIVYPENLSFELCKDNRVEFSFYLPAGSYATVLMAEFIKG